MQPLNAGDLNAAKPVRVAYLIMAHQSPSGVKRLVNRLQAPDHGFFIHYDLRSSEGEYQQLVSEFKGAENVKFLKRYKCSWGACGMVRGLMEGIHEVARMDFPYDYAVHVTGQDYPLKSDAAIRRRLGAANGGSFMQATPWPIPGWLKGRAIRRLENYYIHIPMPSWVRKCGWQPAWQHITIPMKRKIPGGLHPHFGSALWWLHRGCQQVLHEYVMRNPGFLDFFDHTFVPDETMVQTVVMNSKMAPTVTTRTLTYIDWRPPWPGILTVEDLPKLKETDCLLARKFSPAVDSRVLDELDSLVAK